MTSTSRALLLMPLVLWATTTAAQTSTPSPRRTRLPLPVFRNVSVAWHRGEQGAPSGGAATLHPSSSTSATEDTMLLAMNHAVDIAKRVVSEVCASATLRVAPLAFERMATSASTGPLMRMHAPFVLMNVSSVEARMGPVYVPVALARRLVLGPNATARVVWGTPDLTPEQEQEALARLWESVPFDVYVAVNVAGASFALGDSDCALVSNAGGYYSIVSTLVHELLHGMGVYSLMAGDRSGGLEGHVSIFDALLRTQHAKCDADSVACYALSASSVHHVAGDDLAGSDLWFAESRVYNPPEFEVGSSLSHFVETGTVMNSTIAHSTCRFRLTTEDVDALRLLGWQDCDRDAAAHEWNTTDTLFPESLLSRLLGGEAAVHSTCGAHAHLHGVGECVCDSGYSSEAGRCVAGDAAAAAWVLVTGLVTLFLVLPVLAWGLWCVCRRSPYAEMRVVRSTGRAASSGFGGNVYEPVTVDEELVDAAISGRPVFVIE